MPIPQEINDFLSEVGLPTTAIALAVGLVRGAKALETDASPRALKYLSGLLTAGNAASFGKVGATLVPLVLIRNMLGPMCLVLNSYRVRLWRRPFFG